MDIYVFLLYIGLTLIVGYGFGKMIERLSLPAITGYILAGMILGPSVLNVIDSNILSNFNIILNVVLGIIAYQIGTELWFPKVKKSGKSIVTITSTQTVLTAVIVFVAVYLIDGRLWS